MRKYQFICYIFITIIFSIVNSYSNNEIISLIENEWNNTKSLSGSFIQIDQDNNEEKGKFYMQNSSS